MINKPESKFMQITKMQLIEKQLNIMEGMISNIREQLKIFKTYETKETQTDIETDPNSQTVLLSSLSRSPIPRPPLQDTNNLKESTQKNEKHKKSFPLPPPPPSSPELVKEPEYEDSAYETLSHEPENGNSAYETLSHKPEYDLDKLNAPTSVDYNLPKLTAFELYYLTLKDKSYEEAKETWNQASTEFHKIYENKANYAHTTKNNNLIKSPLAKGNLSGYQLFCKIMLQFIDPDNKEESKDKFRTIANIWKKLSNNQKMNWDIFSLEYNKWTSEEKKKHLLQDLLNA